MASALVAVAGMALICSFFGYLRRLFTALFLAIFATFLCLNPLVAVPYLAGIILILVFMGLFFFDTRLIPPRKQDRARILFYDGDCGLCTNSVKFFIEADRAGIIRYAPLQGQTAAQYLPKELRDASALSTVVYLQHSESTQSILTRSDAIYAALRDIGGMWRICAWALYCVPRPIREGGYKFIAKHRLKIFPKGACALPTQEERGRLLP